MENISQPVTSGRARRGRVLWVTNIAPPYRIPVWRELATSWQLTVGLLERRSRLARDAGANRGADWALNRVPGAEVHEYRTARVRRGEDRHYGLVTPDAARDLHRCDVVLLGGWDSPAYFQLLAQAKASGKAAVGFHESTLASQSRSVGAVARVRAAYFKRLDRVVVPGPAARDAVLAMGVEPRRVLTGFNAVDLDVFRAVPEQGARGAGHRFLYVGQLIPRKNLDSVLVAFAAIAGPEDRITLIGKGALRAQLEQRAAQLGVADRTEFLAHVPNSELPAVMATHDTLVLASHVEVWGLVVNEALATGMQAVVTRNCGVAQSVEGMPGVLLAAEDATDLADVMRRARDQFVGRIDSPPILKHTPGEFANVFSEAFDQALSEHHGGRRGGDR